MVQLFFVVRYYMQNTVSIL